MELPKRWLLINAFLCLNLAISLQFGCATEEIENNMIDRLQTQCLRIICNDKYSTFEELLENDNSVTIHKGNLCFLATEMLKVMNDISSSVNELFDCNEGDNYNFRNPSDISLPIVKTVFSGQETLKCLSSKLWELVQLGS